jgi:acetyl esterase/lipase
MRHSRIYLPCILLFLLCGCTSTGLFLANGIARLGEYDVEKDIKYGSLDVQQLDIYTPKPARGEEFGDRPVIIFFYGGCWGACNTIIKDKYAFVAETLSDMGYIVVIPNYRLYPDELFPEIISDASVAVEWVAENINKHGGDAGAMFLMGHSAGAHLAAMLTIDERYLKAETHDSIRGFVGMAGPYDFMPLIHRYQRILFGPEEKFPDSQPINFVDGSEPPFLLLYGDQDEVVKPRNIENLAALANEKGVDVTSIRYPNLNHAQLVAVLSRVLKNRNPVAADIMTFLEQNSP